MQKHPHNFKDIRNYVKFISFKLFILNYINLCYNKEKLFK